MYIYIYIYYTHISLCTHVSNKRLDTITKWLKCHLTFKPPNWLTNECTN